MAMEPADSIGRLGFARWYERRLIEGHAWFVSTFVCTILIAAVMEELTFRGSAARLLGEWDRPYARELGAYPLGSLRASKYFPPVSRIDAAYGDRNLVCTCPPPEAYA